MKVMGMGFKPDAPRRCDWCRRPVKFGYLVNDPQAPTHGFFCGRPHYEAAANYVINKKKEQRVKADKSEG
jgi:hypothetical protein